MSEKALIAKIPAAIMRPGHWGRYSRQLWKLVRHVANTGEFSFNLNTKPFWDQRLTDYGDFWRDDYYHFLDDALPKETAFSLLDVGSALGDGCEYLAKQFPEAEINGIDFSHVGIEKAKRRNSRVNYKVADILKDPLERDYDYVVIIETLEHFDNPFQVIDRCLANTKKKLVISTPYTRGHSGPIIGVSEHRYYFSEKTLDAYGAEYTMSSKKRIIYTIDAEKAQQKN